MEAELHPLTRAEGSALVTMGDSSYMAGVYGPQRVKRRNRYHPKKITIRVSYRTKTGRRAAPFRKVIEKNIRCLLNELVLRVLHPRTYIRVAVLEIYTQVSVLSSIANAINAIILAAMDASIPMTYQVGAVTCAILSKPVIDVLRPDIKFKTPDYSTDEYEIAITPTAKQMKRWKCEMMFAFDNIDLGLVSTQTLGSCSVDQYLMCLDMAKKTVEPMFTQYREITVARFEKLVPQPLKE